MIPQRKLGSTGMEVGILGLGTVKLGRNTGVKYPGAFDLPNDRQAADIIALARDHGINLIDTAPAYGTSEERLGYLLHGQRDHWLICSKVGEEFTHGVSSFDFTPEHTRLSIERSLQRLRTDVLDIVLVHSDGNDLAIINACGTLDALTELKREGKVRAFGMSTKTVTGGLLAAQKADVVMVTWNLQHQTEIPVIDYAYRHNKGVLIKKALASGHVAQARTADHDLTGKMFSESGLAVKETAAGHQDQPVNQSLAMIFAHPGVSSAIIGTINPQHLLTNIQGVLTLGNCQRETARPD